MLSTPMKKGESSFLTVCLRSALNPDRSLVKCIKETQASLQVPYQIKVKLTLLLSHRSVVIPNPPMDQHPLFADSGSNIGEVTFLFEDLEAVGRLGRPCSPWYGPPSRVPS